MGVEPTPAAEVEVTEGLVRRLLVDQHPDLADRPVARAGSGWDNVLFRLGDDLVVRLPRRALSVPLVANEQRWLPVLAPGLPVPVPVPVRTGRPALGYPWPWSVCRWIEGTPAWDDPPFDPVAMAVDLGAFLRALHRPAPGDAPLNPYRGVPLSGRTASVHERAARLSEVIDAPSVLACWEALVAVPGSGRAPRWLHGDLHPGNVVIRDGRLAGVVDFGDLAAGDPATDLAVAWTLLPASARPVLREAVGDVDDDTWRRGRGWALTLSLAYLGASADSPAMAAVGRRGLDAALAGPD